MKKKIAALAATGALLLSALPALAVSRNGNGPAGKSHKAHMFLVEKDDDWNIIEGAWGKMVYGRKGGEFKYSLNAHGLTPNQAYQVEFVVEGTTYAVASVVANGGGNLHLSDSITEWAEGTCVGSYFESPVAVSEFQEFKVLVKTDGNPTSGADGNGLTCSGDGTSIWDYVLFEYDMGTI